MALCTEVGFVILLDIAAAFAVSVLCGMGVGGGGLFVIYMTLARSAPQLDAQGINLAFFACSSVFALVRHFRKRKLDLRLIASLAYTGALGSLIGTALTEVLTSGIIRTVFGVFLIFGGMTAFFGNKKKSPS